MKMARLIFFISRQGGGQTKLPPTRTVTSFPECRQPAATTMLPADYRGSSVRLTQSMVRSRDLTAAGLLKATRYGKPAGLFYIRHKDIEPLAGEELTYPSAHVASEMEIVIR